MRVEQLIKHMCEEFDRVEHRMAESRNYAIRLEKEVEKLRIVIAENNLEVSLEKTPKPYDWCSSDGGSY